MHTLQLRQQLHKFIDSAEDIQVNAIYTLLEEKIGLLNKRISVKDYNKEIEESEKEYDNGNFISQNELREETKKW